jgi:hypothetical protein
MDYNYSALFNQFEAVQPQLVAIRARCCGVTQPATARNRIKAPGYSHAKDVPRGRPAILG